jgi:hypothetical protein
VNSANDIDFIANHPDLAVRSTVAQDPATPPATLDRLANAEDWKIRDQVARNPATPLATLDRLRRDLFDSISRKALLNTAHRTVATLSNMERAWFLTSQWGSWVYAVGKDLVAKGLTEVVNGNVTMTPLGLAVQEILVHMPRDE